MRGFKHPRSAAKRIPTAKIRAEMIRLLPADRVRHTLSVEREAQRLAEMLLSPPMRERVKSDLSAAALLHDITKDKREKEQLELYRKYAIPLDDEERAVPAVFHSRTGAYLARQLFRINRRVFRAILRHTVGANDMNALEKILFLADVIEPERKHPACVQLRKEFYDAYQDISAGSSIGKIELLDKMILKSLDNTIASLIKRNKVVHSAAVKARNRIVISLSGGAGKGNIHHEQKSHQKN